MRRSQEWIVIWFAENQQEMIKCPYQPGNLVISKSACFKRYRIGKKLRDLQETKFESGYSLCGQCPIGGTLDNAAKKAHTVR